MEEVTPELDCELPNQLSKHQLPSPTPVRYREVIQARRTSGVDTSQCRALLRRRLELSCPFPSHVRGICVPLERLDSVV